MEMRDRLKTFMEWGFIVERCDNNIKMDVSETGFLPTVPCIRIGVRFTCLILCSHPVHLLTSVYRQYLIGSFQIVAGSFGRFVGATLQLATAEAAAGDAADWRLCYRHIKSHYVLIRRISVLGSVDRNAVTKGIWLAILQSPVPVFMVDTGTDFKLRQTIFPP
jgi:hypothetical protein